MENFARVAIRGIADSGERLWFCNLLCNTLCSMDKTERTIRLESFLPYSGFGCLEYGPIAYLEDVLYIAPIKAGAFLIYNTIDKTITRVPIKKDYMPAAFGFGNLFFDIRVYRGNIYMIPGRYGAIIKIDSKSKATTYIDSWVGEIGEHICEDGRITFSFGNMIVEDVLYMPFWQGNYIVSLDLKSDKTNIIRIGDKRNTFSAIDFEDNNQRFWLAVRDHDTIIKADLSGRILESINIKRKLVPDSIYGVQFIKLIDHFLYVFLFQGDRIIRVDLDTKHQEEVYPKKDNDIEIGGYIVERINFLYEAVLDKELVLYSSLYGKLIRFTPDGSEVNIEETDTYIDDVKETDLIRRKMCLTRHWGYKKIHDETSVFTLQDYLMCDFQPDYFEDT